MASYIESDVRFRSGQRELVGKINLQPSSHNRLALIAHAYRHDMNAPLCVDAAKAFQAEGYSTLRFNLTGHESHSGGLEQVSFRTITEDVESATEFFKQAAKDKDMKTYKLVFFGVSLGAAAMVLSSVRPDAQFLVSPLIDEQELYHRYQEQIDKKAEQLIKLGYVELDSVSGRGSFMMGREWIEEARANNVGLQARYGAITVPTILAYGSNDETVAKMIKTVAARNRGLLVENIAGANHDFTVMDHRKKLIADTAIPWLDRQV